MKRNLNNDLVIQALNLLLSQTPVGEVFLRQRIQDQINTLRVADMPELLSKEGGPHLAQMRSWIRQNTINGDRVQWGSTEQLRIPPISVADMEYLAAQIASAARNELRGHYT